MNDDHCLYYGTALGAAVAKRHISIIKLLLERGADVNIITGVYGTALGIISAMGNIRGMMILLPS